MRFRQFFLLGTAAAMLSTLVLAGPITHLIVFGDSLSDNGNFNAATGRVPPPYWNGRVSNGPVAPEILATNMGLTLLDFAWAGATTGVGNINDIPTIGTTTTLGSELLPGMTTTFAVEKVKPYFLPLAPSSEFILWGGAMDFIYPSEPYEAAIGRGVTNLVQMTYELQAMGAGMIVVPGMPDLGLTPRIMSYGPAAALQASLLTDFFNATLQANLPPGAIFFDTAALMRAIIADPAAYGLTNVSEPCLILGPTPSMCADPDSYFFWDDIHPSAATHAILAESLQAIPEPSTFLLLLPALAVLASVRHRARLNA